ncbi:hypothetical protein NDU88_003406 [Pleurodeles waltl]|uniref:Uncharacterized protein n=1 Tax=Pleurodeles waltl TaxID=8319 RepID=A0AAV7V0K6_PLEWA|nr:hypothetical protein NDU88_003406 [Pleurodeles waltl]
MDLVTAGKQREGACEMTEKGDDLACDLVSDVCFLENRSERLGVRSRTVKNAGDARRLQSEECAQSEYGMLPQD